MDFAEECERVCRICDALDCPAADGGDPDTCRLVWDEGREAGVGIGTTLSQAMQVFESETRDCSGENHYGISPEHEMRARLTTALDLLDRAWGIIARRCHPVPRREFIRWVPTLDARFDDVNGSSLEAEAFTRENRRLIAERSEDE